MGDRLISPKLIGLLSSNLLFFLWDVVLECAIVGGTVMILEIDI